MCFKARCQYDERPVLVSDISFEGDAGLTKQADAKDCDLNTIFKKYERSGQLPDMIVREPRYGDFAAVPDYQEACNMVNMVTEQFNNLSAEVRNRFENNPTKFLEFVNNPDNVPELYRMGLLNAEATARFKAEEKVKVDAKSAEIDAKAAADERKLIDKIKAELEK